jgi:hypothetical protein
MKLFHYTNADGYEGIQEQLVIRPSRRGIYGPYVYLTDVDPERHTKPAIAKLLYLGGFMKYLDAGRVDLHVSVDIPSDEVQELRAHIFRYAKTGELDLKKYKAHSFQSNGNLLVAETSTDCAPECTQLEIGRQPTNVPAWDAGRGEVPAPPANSNQASCSSSPDLLRDVAGELHKKGRAEVELLFPDRLHEIAGSDEAPECSRKDPPQASGNQTDIGFDDATNIIMQRDDHSLSAPNEKADDKSLSTVIKGRSQQGPRVTKNKRKERLESGPAAGNKAEGKKRIKAQ